MAYMWIHKVFLSIITMILYKKERFFFGFDEKKNPSFFLLITWTSSCQLMLLISSISEASVKLIWRAKLMRCKFMDWHYSCHPSDIPHLQLPTTQRIPHTTNPTPYTLHPTTLTHTFHHLTHIPSITHSIPLPHCYLGPRRKQTLVCRAKNGVVFLEGWILNSSRNILNF